MHWKHYKEHKPFNNGFTLHPFTATEHFDVKTPKYNVMSHYFRNNLPCNSRTCDDLPICCKCHGPTICHITQPRQIVRPMRVPAISVNCIPRKSSFRRSKHINIHGVQSGLQDTWSKYSKPRKSIVVSVSAAQ